MCYLYYALSVLCFTGHVHEYCIGKYNFWCLSCMFCVSSSVLIVTSIGPGVTLHMLD